MINIPEYLITKQIKQWYLSKNKSIINSDVLIPLKKFHSLSAEKKNKQKYSQREEFIIYLLVGKVIVRDNSLFSTILDDYFKIVEYESVIKNNKIDDIKKMYEDILYGDEYIDLINKSDESNIYSNLAEIKEKMNAYLLSTFDYEKRIKSIRSDLLHKVGISVCPYCNFLEFNDFYEGLVNANSNTAELDHFLDKGDYVLLSMSLFNFIPSCHNCNSKYKGTKKLQYYLYLDSLNDKIKFYLKSKNDEEDDMLFDLYSSKKNDDIRLRINYICDKSEFKKVRNDLVVLRIGQVYCNDRNKIALKEALRIKQLRINYNNETTNQMGEILTSKKQNDYIKRYIGFDVSKEEEIINNRFSKLTKDIWNV